MEYCKEEAITTRFKAGRYISALLVLPLLFLATSCELIPLFEVDVIAVRFDSTSTWSGVEVTFRATIDNANAYNWDFGDGATGTGQIVTHVYQSEGIFIVTLELITDSNSFEYSKEVRVFSKFTRLLTVVGTGDGQVTGASAINCTITSGTPSGQCDEEVLENSEFTLTATPTSTFTAWTNCSNPAGNICTDSLTADKTITANFVELFTLTVGMVSLDGGSRHIGASVTDPTSTLINCRIEDDPNDLLLLPIVVGDCSEVLADGTVIVLTATPGFDNSSTFDSWTDCPSPAGNVCTITMNADLHVTANFIKQSGPN